MAETVLNAIMLDGVEFISKEIEEYEVIHLDDITTIKSYSTRFALYKYDDGHSVPFTLVTHNGKFHPDEVVAVSLLNLFGFKYNLTRTRNQEKIERADLSIDVGGAYSPTGGQFDHHQFNEGASNYGKSSAGLIFDWLIEEASEKITSFVASVDARDTRIGEVDPRWGSILQGITDINHIDVDGEAQDERFELVVFLTTQILRDLLDDKDLRDSRVQLLRLADETKKEKEATFAKRREESFFFNGVLYGEFFPEWVDDVTPENPIFVLRDKKGVKVMTNTDFCRIVDIEDATFVHPNGFTGGSTETSPNIKVVIDGEERPIKVHYMKGFSTLVTRQNHMGVHTSYVEISDDGWENVYSLEYPKNGGFKMISDRRSCQFSPVAFEWR
jgi:uncharacterized UPF0160 family protein